MITKKNDLTGEMELWKHFVQSQDSECRVKLVEFYLPYARMIAAMLYARRHHNEIAFDDYHQLARVGLLEAIDRFDSTRGLQFNTFADQRIRGAILNGLEKQTEKQRQIAVIKRLEAERGEVIKAMVFEDEGFGEGNKDRIFAFLADVGIGLAITWMLEGTGIARCDVDEQTESPFYKSVEIKQIQEQLKEQVDRLPAMEQRVIRYHYFQQMTMDEIAQICSLTKGRISQIHKAALQRLKGGLKVSSMGELVC